MLMLSKLDDYNVSMDGSRVKEGYCGVFISCFVVTEAAVVDLLVDDAVFQRRVYTYGLFS